MVSEHDEQTNSTDASSEVGEDAVDDVDAPETEGARDEDIEAASTPEITDEEQTWAVVLQASAFSGLVVPFGNILGPLLVWLIKKDESQFVDENGREALNFQLTWTMLMLGALLSIVIGVGFLLVPIIAVAWIVLVVLATIRASEKTVYEFPLTLDLIE